MFDRCWLGILALAGLLSMLAGCGSGKSGGDTPAIGDPKVLYNMHCSKCHAQAGESGGPKIGSSKAPDLTHIGSKPGRDVEWFAKVIRDPKSVISNAKLMPKFEGVLKDEEIHTLAEYLAGLK
ncbi:MAG TPA: cytochrome c [Gemmata sp.]|jgi:mono/diheme cytochrome c family protein|nr:cytochrome c [Gemmata sp.]